MKVLKWLVIFVVAFLFAWILIFTFMQEPFKVAASAKILTYTTPQIPIYLYVAGAFAIGLLVGLFTAFYYYVVLQKKVHQATRELQSLEQKLADARRALEVNEMSQPSPELPSYAEQSTLYSSELNDDAAVDGDEEEILTGDPESEVSDEEPL